MKSEISKVLFFCKNFNVLEISRFVDMPVDIMIFLFLSLRISFNKKKLFISQEGILMKSVFEFLNILTYDSLKTENAIFIFFFAKFN